MSQDWTSDTFAAGHVAQTDLQNMENNFLALQSAFSGAVQPAGAVAGQSWFDTGQLVLKTRNGDNDEWYGLMHGDVSEKRLVYRDAAMEGYARDSGVTDKVIALKGGATYVAGAATAGSWVIGGITSANESTHTHTTPNHTHVLGTSGTVSSKAADSYICTDGATDCLRTTIAGGATFDRITKTTTSGGGSTSGAGAAHNHAVTQDGTARIAAAVCILIYLDL